MWWILRTGAPWNQLPERFGKWNSVYRQHLRWSKEGLWPDLLAMVANAEADESEISIDATHLKAHQDACRHPVPAEIRGLGKTKGGRNSKLNAVVDAHGRLIRMKLVPGNDHEVTSAAEVLGTQLEGSLVHGDKGYQSEELAVHIYDAGGIPNIPSREGTKDPLPYHKELGKIRRLVENFFARLKRSRRVATRYEKLAETYMAFVTLVAIDDWVRS